MEDIPSVCFQAWSSVLDFFPDMVARSYRSFVCWFFLNQFVGIVAVSDVEFEFVSDLDEKFGNSSSGGRRLKMVLIESGIWKSSRSRIAGTESSSKI